MGRSVPAARGRILASVSSRDRLRSLRPREVARPTLVVAMALKPSFSRMPMSPTLQAFGMTRNSSWSSLKSARTAFMFLAIRRPLHRRGRLDRTAFRLDERLPIHLNEATCRIVPPSKARRSPRAMSCGDGFHNQYAACCLGKNKKRNRVVYAKRTSRPSTSPVRFELDVAKHLPSRFRRSDRDRHRTGDDDRIRSRVAELEGAVSGRLQSFWMKAS